MADLQALKQKAINARIERLKNEEIANEANKPIENTETGNTETGNTETGNTETGNTETENPEEKGSYSFFSNWFSNDENNDIPYSGEDSNLGNDL